MYNDNGHEAKRLVGGSGFDCFFLDLENWFLRPALGFMKIYCYMTAVYLGISINVPRLSTRGSKVW